MEVRWSVSIDYIIFLLLVTLSENKLFCYKKKKHFYYVKVNVKELGAFGVFASLQNVLNM